MALAGLAHSRWLRPLMPARFRERHPIVPVVRLAGAIGAISPVWSGLTLAAVAPVLERAFAVEHAAAVAILVNSPGGSAVQAHLVYQRIRALAEESKRSVFVFIEDAAASGGYMIACAGDEIFADPSSIVGSIGVIYTGFGFDRAIEKVGIERRLITAGRLKGMLDAFQPLKAEEVERLVALQTDIHRHFVAIVETRRAGKLADNQGDLFTGEFWTGTRAKDLGLVDGLGDLRGVMRQRFGERVVLKPFSTERTLFGRRIPGLAITEAALPAATLAAIEERALWARYGL